MPSNRSSRQTSTTNLDRQQEEAETTGTRTTNASRKAKISKSNKALNAVAVEVFEEANGPLLPSPSHDSLVQNTSTTAKRKDVEFLNTINGMINKSAEKMTTNFNKRFSDIEDRIVEKMQALEDTQTQEMREMGKEIRKLQILPEKIEELNKRVTDGEAILKSTIDAQHEALTAGQRRIAALEDRLANLPDSSGYNPSIMKKMDDLDQRLKNRSLLINGLNERYQNEDGVLGLAAEVLRVHLEYTDIDEIWEKIRLIKL